MPWRARRGRGGEGEDTRRYLDLSSLYEAAATFRGTRGYWTGNGPAFLGLGPASPPESQGCSSLLRWTPTTNTVSLFGPPGVRTCYRLPDTRSGELSSASGRYALVDKYGTVPGQDGAGSGTPVSSTSAPPTSRRAARATSGATASR